MHTNRVLNWTLRACAALLIALLFSAGAFAAGRIHTVDSLIDSYLMYWKQHDIQAGVAVMDALRDRAEEAVPKIRARLDDPDIPLRVKFDLLYGIGGFSGDEQPPQPFGELLFEIAMRDRLETEIGRSALYRFQDIHLPVKPSPEQTAWIVDKVRNGKVSTAGSFARILGHCWKLPAEDRARPIVDRLYQQLVDPDPVPEYGAVYVSPRVHALNYFLLGLSYIGPEAIPVIDEYRQKTADPEVGTWLLMALGFAGDASVVESMKAIVEEHPNKYVRLEALCALGHCGSPEDRDFITPYLDDPTESEYGRNRRGKPARLLRAGAQSALSGIRDRYGK